MIYDVSPQNYPVNIKDTNIFSYFVNYNIRWRSFLCDSIICFKSNYVRMVILTET